MQVPVLIVLPMPFSSANAPFYVDTTSPLMLFFCVSNISHIILRVETGRTEL